eukprot:SM000009S23551  [mRNA]  locus=s9:640474:643572:- [translate_table: standard]
MREYHCSWKLAKGLNEIVVAWQVKKMGRVAYEAAIRGIKKVEEKVEGDEDDDLNVAGWHNAAHPEVRLKFWSEPDTELKLAKDTNASVYRLGIDWGRIVVREPKNGMDDSVIDWKAVKHYRWILERVKSYNMKIMLTIFHHSLPIWAHHYGGWRKDKTVKYFVDFTRLVVEEFGDLVEWWITFNEPHVFAMLTYCAGAWPGGDPSLLEQAMCVMPKGVYTTAMDLIAKSHNEAYDVLHEVGAKKGFPVRVGLSHHISFMRPYGLMDVPAVMFTMGLTTFQITDDTYKKLDFIGVNYYGQEFVNTPGLKLKPNEEFSESGRGIYPDGLFRILVAFNERYNVQRGCDLPMIITESGISDSTDKLRRPYIIEHLLAVRCAMDRGIKVQGYLYWTTSDNWEWADGYGPKFGLCSVDRENDLKRSPRPSFYLYKEISATGKVTKEQRDGEWGNLQKAIQENETRPFCREVDDKGLMYAGGLDEPVQRGYSSRDWRFGHYEVDGLQDSLSRFSRFALGAIRSVIPFVGQKNQGVLSPSGKPQVADLYKGVPSGAPPAELEARGEVENLESMAA